MYLLSRLQKRCCRKRLLLLLLGALMAIALLPMPSAALLSNAEVTAKAPFNQPDFYALNQTLPAALYQPSANWLGRLILPTPEEQGPTDWVWMQVYHAPPAARELIGQRVRLTWSADPALQRDVATVTRDVRFTPEVEAKQLTSRSLFPTRLNGRSQVGPLQSITGARPQDDVVVSLNNPVVLTTPNSTVLQIHSEPLLQTGRYVTLVKILGTATPADPGFTPTHCPGGKPCPHELLRVQHYNPVTGQFDGLQETVRIPQQPMNAVGIFNSTPRAIEQSPAGEAGWYLYGAQDQNGLFTVQAIEPRSLLQLKPQQVLLGKGQGFHYINFENWTDTKTRKGTLQTVLIDPTASTAADAIDQWQEGDRVLVIHLFGGRGGREGERPKLGTVTGHFSFGVATVVRDRFTNELRLDVTYHQIYATNPDGIISGHHTWTSYMGDLQRGWAGTRPVADVLVKLAELEDYHFGDITISPMAQLTRQLSLISARYRTGDGTGSADVTPATSCVQDSNQALFVTIDQIRRQVLSSPAIQQWWATHPHDPTVQRFEQLIRLADDLERYLTPFGIVRADWKTNADILAGTTPPASAHPSHAWWQTLLEAFGSWRTILPRQAQDELSIRFLKHGAKLWVLRTNQIGGNDPDIYPIAPTHVFGAWLLPGTNLPIVTILITRLLGAIEPPVAQDWLVGLAVLLGYGAIALPLGWAQHLLQYQPWETTWWHKSLLVLQFFFIPALCEELVFRVLLLPSPQAGVTLQMWLLWAIAGLFIFIIYHPLYAIAFHRSRYSTFLDPGFLTLTGLLGIACTVAYGLTGSLLIITGIHWIIICVWLIFLGGMKRLYPQTASPEIHR